MLRSFESFTPKRLKDREEFKKQLKASFIKNKIPEFKEKLQSFKTFSALCQTTIFNIIKECQYNLTDGVISKISTKPYFLVNFIPPMNNKDVPEDLETVLDDVLENFILEKTYRQTSLVGSGLKTLKIKGLKN